MVQETPLIALPIDWETALNRAIGSLEDSGLQVVRSFDLRVARSVHANCACPHHGTEQCDCQMVVLLIYDQQKPPLTLVVHGHDGRVNFVLVDSSKKDTNRKTESLIRQALVPRNFSNNNQERWPHAS